MKRSVDRILTSHVGSLPRPADLRALYANGSQEELAARLRAAVTETVQQQFAAGIDIVNDGEFGKPMTDEFDTSAWGLYHYARLAGYEQIEINIEAAGMPGRDRRDFADFYAGTNLVTGTGVIEVGVPVAPIRYIGHDVVSRDVENVKAALGGRDPASAFVSAVSPGGSWNSWGDKSFYDSSEDEVIAIAEAMREEYRAITDAGLSVQLDDPFLANIYEFQYSESRDDKAFRKWAERHIELLNYSLEGIPEEQVRYHLCWGSWKGPHSSDLPLEDAIDLIVKIDAQLYSVEAANPQHEHEWRAWKNVDLPDGRMVMPGVVTHKTDILEHPRTVADRIVRYAEVIGRENVIAGTDCGMGGRIHPQLAWAKLRVLAEGAELASAELWG